MFLDDIPRLRPLREIEFGMNLDPDAKQIRIPPYKMAQSELKELKLQLKDLTYKCLI